MRIKPGERVRRWRQLRGITQSDLADRARMDNSKLSRIESCESKARAEDIERLARALSLTMPEFYGDISEAS